MAESYNHELLKDSIVYQEGSIVSKQIIKKPNGNITLFAFAKDESLTEHTSPYEAVVYMADGEMEIKIGGEPVIVKTGEILVMPANIPHGLKALSQAKMLLTMIK
ncbi:MAG: cupin domain-containing protein [Ignavibacteriales bacterium]|jgi:quercetin dioxygenase-like cupin family protein|nr:cupin domain-containing protein [Ignavibacteriaceae bacterium]NLH59955.1 cupin domain-containing protein [Ignavibacteriales bacterium]HOJ18086.1 cupin domain-containing protein [Ignavibacteriaceae bacterium]HPO56616.1 cupin domain-containing protein [Ignavibacteriaceae bacterium]